MKVLVIFCLAGLLPTAHGSRAQTVLQGDSIYQGLQPHKDFLASVVAQFGKHYHKTEQLAWIHLLLSGGGDAHSTRLAGYALHYKRLGATFCVDEKTSRLYRIQLDRKASAVSTRGIRPDAAVFATVIERYGPSQQGKEEAGQPKVKVFSFDHKIWYTSLRYPHITFISYGKPAPGENLLLRKVQEIWLW